MKRLLSRPGTVLSELAANVVVVEDPVTSDISSTKVREQVVPLSVTLTLTLNPALILTFTLTPT